MTEIRAGLNGDMHSLVEIEHYGPVQNQFPSTPLPCGVHYLGDGQWTLPEGAKIEPRAGEDWLLTMPDDAELYMWSEG